MRITRNSLILYNIKYNGEDFIMYLIIYYRIGFKFIKEFGEFTLGEELTKQDVLNEAKELINYYNKITK